MKSYVVFLVILLLAGCRQGSMKQKELSAASVVRDTAAAVIDTVPAVDTVATPVVPLPETTAPAAVSPASPGVMASPSGRFHVIVASYSARSLAEKEVRRLRAKGYPEARIVFKDRVHYRVSVANFPTQKAALSKLSTYERALRVNGAWVTLY